MEWKGYTGKMLNVDLTDNKISVSKESQKDIKQFIGGFGMNCKLGADLIRPKIDPLSIENPIIIGTGPLVGTITPGASRTVGFTKSLNYGDIELKFQDFFGETIITQEIATQLLNDYYDERGWDNLTGTPTKEKIKELDLEEYL